jgi:hypothetical protein
MWKETFKKYFKAYFYTIKHGAVQNIVSFLPDCNDYQTIGASHVKFCIKMDHKKTIAI